MRRRLGAILALAISSSLVAPPAVEAAPARDRQSEVERLSNQISQLDEDYNDARIKLSKVDRQIRDIGVAKEEADRRLEVLRQKASSRAAAAYRAGMPDLLLVLFDSSSISDFTRRLGIATRVGDWESGVMTDLEIANNRADAQAENLRRELSRARSLTDSIAKKRAALRTKVNEQKRLLEQQRAREAAASRRQGSPVSRAAREANLPAPALPTNGNVRSVLETAYAQIGKPYSWGAGGPGSFDCSGFTSFAWRAAGVSLPHSSRAQYAATKRVAREDWRPGDLVFFGSPIHHVGIYVGDNKMIDSSTYGHPVGIRSLNRRGYVGAGRPGV
jgi:cell wall-associated NlpC family hydrolase